jgi:transcriptional regulator with XRE-family HTH domain
METPTPETAVAHNIAELRAARKHTVRTLSARLGELGRPILPSGITKIENQQRRVDPGELVAISLALGVNPNRLLLPIGDRNDEVALTPTIAAPHRRAWSWAQGRFPAPVPHPEGPRPLREAVDDFRQHALPTWMRLRDDHTAVRAAEELIDDIRDLLDGEDAPTSAGYRTPAEVRRTLKRVVAEVEHLIGGDDGDR